MMQKAIILLALGITSTLASSIDDKIGFVFEAVRHGARAPLVTEPPGYF